MLVLSRHVGESIMIGHDITVTVLEVRGDVVRIGIDAPRDVKVHRQEVYEEVAKANRAAAAASAERMRAFASELSQSSGNKPTEK